MTPLVAVAGGTACRPIALRPRGIAPAGKRNRGHANDIHELNPRNNTRGFILLIKMTSFVVFRSFGYLGLRPFTVYTQSLMPRKKSFFVANPVRFGGRIPQRAHPYIR